MSGADQYDLICFDGDIIQDRIEFDYLIKVGIVSKRNGLLILRLLGIEGVQEPARDR